MGPSLTPSRRRGLFGRVLRADPPLDASASLLAHLHALLNTRREESAARPDLGLVDFADVVHRFPTSAEMLKDDMKAMLRAFEPRLVDVDVDAVECDDPLRVAFEIRARLAGSEGQWIHLRTELSPSGRFDPPTPKRP